MSPRRSIIFVAALICTAAALSASGSSSTSTAAASVVMGRSAAPSVVQRILPLYPHELRREGLAGRAQVELIVSADGRVRTARVTGATHPDFGRTAREAAMKWRFAAVTTVGSTEASAVVATVSVPFEFSLAGGASVGALAENSVPDTAPRLASTEP